MRRGVGNNQSGGDNTRIPMTGDVDAFMRPSGTRMWRVASITGAIGPRLVPRGPPGPKARSLPGM